MVFTGTVRKARIDNVARTGSPTHCTFTETFTNTNPHTYTYTYSAGSPINWIPLRLFGEAATTPKPYGLDGLGGSYRGLGSR